MLRRFALTALLLGLSATTVLAATPQYRLIAITPVPAMPEGDFDQLVADVARNRLYVSAEDGAAIDVFDLRTGALLRSGGRVGSPHKIAIDLPHNRLFVADGADASVKVLDADLDLVKRIPVGARPDTGTLDPEARIFYVSSREGAGDGPDSVISAISLDSLSVVRTFTVPATTLKGLILDKANHRLLVSMRDKSRIGVVHLDDGRIDIWSVEGLHTSVPLTLDEQDGLLFAGSRNPGELQILDARNGLLRSTLPSTNMSDSMFFDPQGRTLYLSGDDGMSSYNVPKKGPVTLVSTDPALAGKTSLFVASLRRLYVMRPKRNGVAAALQIFEVR